jgi:hypothetical protein
MLVPSHHHPKQSRMEPFGADLSYHDDQEEPEKNQRGDDVADLQGDP